MKAILVDKIEDGMILDKEVSGPSGNILLGKGTRLSITMGRRLKNWGITHVFIEGDEEVEQTGSANKVDPAEIKTLLEKKFEGRLNNPVMKKIFAAIYQFRIQQH